MTAPRSTFLLLLVAACLAMAAGSAIAEPVETPPMGPPAGAADALPDGPPPGAVDEVEEPVVEVMKAAPGRLPSTDGPRIPNVIGKLPHETNQALSAWRIREEQVVTDRSYVGRVVDQHPDAGTTLAPGEVITLVLGIPTLPSRGHTCVPPVERISLEAAAAALRKQGFDIMLRVVESYDRDKGVVLAQAPRPASVATRGSKVVVVVGKGGLADPVVAVEPLPAPPAEAMPVPEADEPTPPAGPPSIPAGPPPGARPPIVEEPPMPPAEEPPTPPADESMPMPPTEEPLPPADESMPLPPADEPLPPADEPMPPAPPVEEPPAPMPVEPPPKVALRVPTLVGPAGDESYPRAFGSTFKWGGISGAQAYEWELQVEAQDGSWSTVATETVEGTTHRPKRMEAGRYRWRVRAVAEGVEGTWSEFRRLYLY